MNFRPDLDALVLAILEQGPSHGYDISRRIEAECEGEVRLQDGQLYPILHRLENEGWIVARWVPQEGKPARKVYSLTDDGRGTLEARRLGWRRFAGAVDKLLGAAPSPGPLLPGVGHAEA
jgi:PadR family transcriptional regulator, regulatory protein PadR